MTSFIKITPVEVMTLARKLTTKTTMMTVIKPIKEDPPFFIVSAVTYLITKRMFAIMLEKKLDIKVLKGLDFFSEPAGDILENPSIIKSIKYKYPNKMNLEC